MVQLFYAITLKIQLHYIICPWFLSYPLHNSIKTNMGQDLRMNNRKKKQDIWTFQVKSFWVKNQAWWEISVITEFTQSWMHRNDGKRWGWSIHPLNQPSRKSSCSFVPRPVIQPVTQPVIGLSSGIFFGTPLLSCQLT